MAGVGGVTLLCAAGSDYNTLVAMAGCGNNFLRHQNFTADSAMLAFGQTGSRAGCFKRCVDYFRMAQSFHIICHIAIATMAGVGGVTLLGASRLGHYCLVAMPGFRDFHIGRIFATLTDFIGIPTNFGASWCFRLMLGQIVAKRGYLFLFEMAAIGAISAFTAILGASGFCDFLPFAEAVAGSRGVVIHIAVAAGYTGVGSLATFRAGWFGHNCFVIVTGGVQNGVDPSAAAGAFTILCAVLGAGGRLRHDPFTVGMPADRSEISLVAVAADAASIGRIALRHAVGRCDFCHIIMPNRFRGIAHIVFAAMADPAGEATLVAGWRVHRGNKIMPQFRNLLHFKVVAVGAISALIALFGAGCICHLVPCAQSMAQSNNVVVHIAVTANAACMRRAALLGAGGLGYNALISMTISRDYLLCNQHFAANSAVFALS